jgi:large subunit ribosomal protein L21
LQILNQRLKYSLQEADPMYAVVNTGGKQYKVQQGEVLRIEKIPGDVGSPVTFDRVLMFSDGENVSIGQPLLEDVAVEGHIVEQGKAKKIIVFKYKRRKRYRRKQGHRQEFTAVLIDSIIEAGAKAKEAHPSEKEPKPEVAKADAAPKAGKDEAEKPAPQEGAEKTETKKAAAPEAGGEKSKAKAAGTKKAESEGQEA